MLHRYPVSISAAAKILDEELPAWFTMIDLNKICMKHIDKCILGQLYVDYHEGLKDLFGLDIEDKDSEGEYEGDDVFGEDADVALWKTEINKRLKHREYSISVDGKHFSFNHSEAKAIWDYLNDAI